MKPPAFQFYAADFLVGTATMTAEEVGAYIRLLCYQWDMGGIPDDDATICRLGGCGGIAVASVRLKFGSAGGMLKNARLEVEREKQQSYRKKQAENGAKRWVGNAKPHARPEPNGCSPSPSSDIREREEEEATAQTRESKRSLPPELDNPQFREAWEKWLVYWADKKHASMPQATADSHLKICIMMGSNMAIIAIDNAIHHGFAAPCLPNEKGQKRSTEKPAPTRFNIA